MFYDFIVFVLLFIILGGVVQLLREIEKIKERLGIKEESEKTNES